MRMLHGHIRAFVNQIDTLESLNLVNDFTSYLKDKGLSSKTILDYRGIFIKVLEYAENEGLVLNIPKNYIKLKNQQQTITVLSIKEQQLLRRYSEENLSVYTIAVLIALYMGLRIGEICALLWSDIDLENGIISITKTMQRIKNNNENADKKTEIIIDKPKTHKSIREVPIPKFIVSILKKIKPQDANEYLISLKPGNFIEPRQLQRKYKSILKETGIRHVNFHNLRHTFATRWVERNIDIKALSEILGHANVETTLRMYVHPTMETKRADIEKIAKI